MNNDFCKNMEFEEPQDAPTDLSAWFSVSGDTDDFIYYDVPERIVSER
ncbi:MAG: hypothetical protein FWG94_01570 [Oscillospiraceae bacterium]|nr:hypothetical protein [Oscillospiraceae bacterium]